MTMTLSIPADAPQAAATYRPTSQDVRRHMHLVYKVVAQMQRKLPRSVQRDDLVSAGTFGLYAALMRSEGDVESASFECYACIRIRGAIVDELRRLDWSPRRRKAPAAALPSNVVPLEAPAARGVNVVRFDDLPPTHEPLAIWGCPEKARDTIETQRTVRAAMATLPAREREILELRYFEDVPAKDIAAKLNVSEARISQLHSRAIAALRRALSENAPRMPMTTQPPPSKFPSPPASGSRRRAVSESVPRAASAPVIVFDLPKAA